MGKSRWGEEGVPAQGASGLAGWAGRVGTLQRLRGWLLGSTGALFQSVLSPGKQHAPGRPRWPGGWAQHARRRTHMRICHASLPGAPCSGDYSAVCDHNCRGACPARSEIRQVQAALASPFALRPPHNSSEPR